MTGARLQRLRRSGLSVRPARVRQIDERGCWVEFEAQRCAGCSGVCGLGPSARHALRINGDPGVVVGSQVDVGIATNGLTATVLRLFGPPLAALLCVPLVHRAFDPSAPEAALATTGAVAVAVAMWVGMRLAEGTGRALKPELLRPAQAAGAIRAASGVDC